MIKAIITFCLISTVAMGGTVHFDPPSITITPGTQTVSFVTRAVPEELVTFDTVSFIFGSLEGLALSFQPDQSLFFGTTTPPPPVPAETGVYDYFTGGIGSDVGYGANRFSNPYWSSLTLGVLVVDTSDLKAGDIRSIIVDPELEYEWFSQYGTPMYESLLSWGVTREPLRGAVTITVVPEPGIAAMMVFGIVVGIRGMRQGRIRGAEHC